MEAVASAEKNFESKQKECERLARVSAISKINKRIYFCKLEVI